MTQKITEVAGGSIVTAKGFQVAGVHSGVKRSRKDLGVIYSEQPAHSAAVYTLNEIQAAPLKITKESLAAEQKLQAVIVNSGNANACTGDQGLEDACTMRTVTAGKYSIPDHYVSVASTGIIGLDMPMNKIKPHISMLESGVTNRHVEQFEESILTTDTFSKSACYQAEIDQQTVTVGAAAKGSGMIEPRMGTMLSFITTDAVIEASVLQQALNEIVEQTFNCITVDGDTSTNDMVLVMANGMSTNESLTPNHPEWDTFIALLAATCEDLAKQIARDGEGATKLIEVQVKGAYSADLARKVAKHIVSSSLVKSAVFGKDMNWGRIIAAIGYSRASINPDTINLSIGPIELLKNSQPIHFYEEAATAYFQEDTIQIEVDLQMGDGSGKAWGCDLTYDYVRINANYRS